jgi:hypothetical protein
MTLVPFERPTLHEEIQIAKDCLDVATAALEFLNVRRSDLVRVRTALGSKAKPHLLHVLNTEIESLDEEVDEAEEFISAWREIVTTLIRRTADA